MVTIKPQARKVLRHLQAAGAEGVHSRQLRADYIADPPSRVCELRRLGHNILRKKEGNGTRYTLIPAEVGRSQSAVDPGGSESRPPGSTSPPRQGPPGVPGLPPAGRGFPGSVPTETKPLAPGRRYAHQPPDGREGWVLVADYTDRSRPSWRWELRVPDQMEAAA